ncbi:MAG: ABC transporter ATP-binding protein [Oscillospiraceae bacterium]|nr:ABC transporter ATP-binding protein [Oscillospiraceae bacterium]
MEPLLEVKNLKIEFTTERGVIQAVRGVSFSVNPGETLALVGESGCGKSVICKSILGVLHSRGRITEGEILFEGRCISKLGERGLAAIRGKEIGMVFQNPAAVLDPTLPIGKQLAEAVRAHTRLSRQACNARVLELLSMVGIDRPEERIYSYPQEFSGGMLQRVVIAIALAESPKLLIADEPTTALDVTVQAHILKLLADLQKKTGIAILFISHDLGVVAQVADRVAILYAGKVVESGTAEEVYTDPRHPYTWGLFRSLPCAASGGPLTPIPGQVPDLLCPPRGDAFAPRNEYALAVDFEEEPPFFHVEGSHYAATWLLHPDAPKIEPPVRIEKGEVLTNG